MGIPERKERERQMRHDAILAASQSVFLDKGLYGATLDEIAERAEVSKGTIYLYFRSKEDLYFSLMAHGLRKLLQAFEATSPEKKSTREIVRSFAEAYRRFSREENYLFRMLGMVESPVASEQVSAKVLMELEDVSDKVLGYVATLVQNGSEGAKLRSGISAYEAVIIFWVSLSGILNLKVRADTMRQKKCANKDAILHRVEYDLLYDKCVSFLADLLLSSSSQTHQQHRSLIVDKNSQRQSKGVLKK